MVKIARDKIQYHSTILDNYAKFNSLKQMQRIYMFVFGCGLTDGVDIVAVHCVLCDADVAD